MKLLYILWQCLWGLPQSAAGAALLPRWRHCPRAWYHGALVTYWEREDGVSLGMFIFVPGRCRGETAGTGPRRLLVHEYGHSIQSLLLGPLYLPVIGLPSAVWCRSRRLAEKRRREGTPYSAFYTERWADHLGERVTGEPSLRR